MFYCSAHELFRLFFCRHFLLFCSNHSGNSETRHYYPRRILRDRNCNGMYGTRYSFRSRAVSQNSHCASMNQWWGFARQWNAIISIVIYDFMLTTNDSERFVVANRQTTPHVFLRSLSFAFSLLNR